MIPNQQIPVVQELAANRASVLRNLTCVYCGCQLTRQTRTKEHVVGRKFVPRGKLDGFWNLIVFACGGCNSKKADLEDDISAITLLPDIGGDVVHRDEAVSKARNSFSRRTGKRVADSSETEELHFQLAPRITASFQFIAPPQVEPERLFELACYHMSAFFYFVSYDEQAGIGGFWPEGFHPFRHANRPDWGNSQIKAFAEAVVSWDTRLFAFTADGYFRCCLRKHPSEACWSWALEWNQNARVVGFVGSRAVAQAIVDSFPELPKVRMRQSGNTVVKYWQETPLLPDDDDLLFANARSQSA